MAVESVRGEGGVRMVAIKPVRCEIGTCCRVYRRGKVGDAKEGRSWRSIRYLKDAKKCRKTDRCHYLLTYCPCPFSTRLPTVHQLQSQIQSQHSESALGTQHSALTAVRPTRYKNQRNPCSSVSSKPFPFPFSHIYY